MELRTVALRVYQNSGAKYVPAATEVLPIIADRNIMQQVFRQFCLDKNEGMNARNRRSLPL